MNNIFSFDRFLKVLKYDFKFCVPQFFTLFAVLVCFIHALEMLFMQREVFIPSARVEGMVAMLFVCIFCAPFTIYSKLNSKHKGSSFIMIPASCLEKFASMTLICLLLVPLAFTVSFLLLDTVLTVCLPEKYVSFIFKGLFEFVSRTHISLFIVPVALSGTAMLGNLVFKKNALSKTLLFSGVATVIWCLVAGRAMLSLINPAMDAENMAMITKNFFILNYIFYTFVGVAMYTLTYFRIRRMQIS